MPPVPPSFVLPSAELGQQEFKSLEKTHKQLEGDHSQARQQVGKWVDGWMGGMGGMDVPRSRTP